MGNNTMAELTEREKKIVLIKFIMHGEKGFGALSVDTREQVLQVAMALLKMKYDKAEMLDLAEAIRKTQETISEAGKGFMTNNKELIKDATELLSKKGALENLKLKF